ELPVLLALSANSPFWRGDHTGLASSRAMIFSAFPRSGLPPRFADYQDYAEAVGFMEATGAIGDYTHLWWSVRPHTRFGTLELGCAEELARIDWILEHGNGADRQRQVWNANRDIAEVAEEIASAAERV